MKDLYGNEQQADTPTTKLIKNRNDKRLESDGHFKLGTRVYPSLKRQMVVEMLRTVALIVEDTNAEDFRFEFTIEEIKEVEDIEGDRAGFSRQAESDEENTEADKEAIKSVLKMKREVKKE